MNEITISWRGIMGNILEYEIKDIHSLTMTTNDFHKLMRSREFELSDYLNSLSVVELRDLLLFDSPLQEKLVAAMKLLED